MDIEFVKGNLEEMLSAVETAASSVPLYVPHAALKVSLHNLSQHFKQKDETKPYPLVYDIVQCIAVLEPLLSGESGNEAIKRLLSSALSCISAPGPEQPLNIALDMLERREGVRKVYRACHFSDTSVRATVVVTENRIDLPKMTSDGSMLLQVVLSEPLKLAPAAPRSPSDAPNREGSREAWRVMEELNNLIRTHKNIMCTTGAPIDGKWGIIVGVTAKGWIPVGEGLFPKEFRGIRVAVAEYRLIPMIL